MLRRIELGCRRLFGMVRLCVLDRHGPVCVIVSAARRGVSKVQPASCTDVTAWTMEKAVEKLERAK